jgi:hypothetical protein
LDRHDNWDNAGTESNREFALIDSDPAVVSQAEAVFAADWVHTPYTGPDDALVLSPNNSRAQIEGLITSARKTLDIFAEEMGDPAVSSDLVLAGRTAASLPCGFSSNLAQCSYTPHNLPIHHLESASMSRVPPHM